jgi:phenylacetic acid degradation operon negative regulatory protein
VSPKLEFALALVFWLADKGLRPSFLNLIGSFESWTYRSGIGRQLGRLESRGLVERRRGPAGERVYRLTEIGRLAALGGRDPEARWSRPWDGKWRMVAFDLPAGSAAGRKRLRRYLCCHGFGRIQGSLWVTPDSPDEVRRELEGGEVDVGLLLVMEGRPCAGESDAEIVSGAWDFEEINRRYSEHLEIVGAVPGGLEPGGETALVRWCEDERAAWRSAVEIDPLLPERLLPKGYLGRRAWRKRGDVLKRMWRIAGARARRPARP